MQIAFSVFSTGEAENTDKISDWYQFLIESEHVLLSISKYVGQICRLSLGLFNVLDKKKKKKQFNRGDLFSNSWSLSLSSLLLNTCATTVTKTENLYCDVSSSL